MARFDGFDDILDSMDPVERRMAMEMALICEIRRDERLSFDAREQLTSRNSGPA